MNIYRLQSVEELELLQNRIKAKLPSRIHLSPLRSDTGTDPEKGGDYVSGERERSSGRQLSGRNAVTGVASVKTRSKPHQDRPLALKTRNWSLTLQNQCKALKLPIPALEYRFHPSRLWRFDCAWVESRVAVEIEGGLWVNGRHNRAAGFLADMMKYNEATKLGWRIYRFSPSQVKKGAAAHFLGKLDL